MSRPDLPVDEILESLGLTRAEPGIGFLEVLFSRFNARVPFETASKIVRNAEVSDPAGKPRRPEVFWTDHLELGTGGTCFARVAAFDALLRAVGFSIRKVLGRVERDFDHAALLVVGASGISIADVGFPLPALLPAGEGKAETALADLVVSRTARGSRIEFVAGVPEGPRALEIFDAEVAEEQFEARWRETFRSDSKFLSQVVLRRQEASRIVSFARGEVRVDDRHSRLAIPIESPRVPRLETLFQIDAGLLDRALELAGDPDAGTVGRLTTYLETPSSPLSAWGAIASPAAYRSLLEGITRIIKEERTPEGWRFVLATPGGEAPGEAALAEDLVAEPERWALRVRRRGQGADSDSEFRVEQRSGRTYMVREAFFQTPREDLLRNDSLRGRLAGMLAADLLAWARSIRKA